MIPWNPAWTKYILAHERGVGYQGYDESDWSEERFTSEYVDPVRNEIPGFDDLPPQTQVRLVDYKFNTGRNVKDLVLFANKDITLDEINSSASFDDKWSDKVAEQLNKPYFASKLDAAKIDVYSTTKTDDPLHSVYMKQDWMPRVTMWNDYPFTASEDATEKPPDVQKTQSMTPIPDNSEFYSPISGKAIGGLFANKQWPTAEVPTQRTGTPSNKPVVTPVDIEHERKIYEGYLQNNKNNHTADNYSFERFQKDTRGGTYSGAGYPDKAIIPHQQVGAILDESYGPDAGKIVNANTIVDPDVAAAFPNGLPATGVTDQTVVGDLGDGEEDLTGLEEPVGDESIYDWINKLREKDLEVLKKQKQLTNLQMIGGAVMSAGPMMSSLFGGKPQRDMVPKVSIPSYQYDSLYEDQQRNNMAALAASRQFRGQMGQPGMITGALANSMEAGNDLAAKEGLARTEYKNKVAEGVANAQTMQSGYNAQADATYNAKLENLNKERASAFGTMASGLWGNTIGGMNKKIGLLDAENKNAIIYAALNKMTEAGALDEFWKLIGVKDYTNYIPGDQPQTTAGYQKTQPTT